ncbi:hypothetical protein AGMMS49574_03260 [Bacteroidia bacterium]|nr:hypothetical protein AGMMS49574_03260 [Bacteroidia bacterium]GHU56226.1 hypothetical protein FACS189411_06340 [Bacteroidia bacterium]GHV05358.1 hypothetical protein FACS189416_4930 [Bacteroidia bacterium]
MKHSYIYIFLFAFSLVCQVQAQRISVHDPVMIKQGDANWYGTGHNGMLNADNKDYLIFHAYDAADNGRSKLRIFQLNWDKENWPVVGEPIY